MDNVDPNTLLEWLEAGFDGGRELQLTALEQLCMILLMSDNIDRCFECCPPRAFIPPLCRIFLDETAPENVLEVTARAITYYLDVSSECTRRITQVEGAVKAICNRLSITDMSSRANKDLAEQCIKLLERVCHRETSAVYDAGGLQCVLSFIDQHGRTIHRDTMHSAMSVITKLSSKTEPTDESLPECSAYLGALLESDDPKVSEFALRCFCALTDRFVRKSVDPAEIARHGDLVERLLNSVAPSSLTVPSLTSSPHMTNVPSTASLMSVDSNVSTAAVSNQKPTSFVSLVISLLTSLCKGSASVAEQMISSPRLIIAIQNILMSKDERCIIDTLRFCDILIILMYEDRTAISRDPVRKSTSSDSSDRSTHLKLVNALKDKDPLAAMTNCFDSQQIISLLLHHYNEGNLNDENLPGLDKNLEDFREDLSFLEKVIHFHTKRLKTKQGASAPKKYVELIEKVEMATNKEQDRLNLDEGVVCALVEKLLPVFCDVFQRSIVMSVRRNCLWLLYRTIHFISSDSLNFLVSDGVTAEEISFESSGNRGHILVDNLMSVLIMALDQEGDIDNQENALNIVKSLLMKNATFWLNQFIQVGVLEKVEALVTQPPPASRGGLVTTMVVDESGHVSSASSTSVMERQLAKSTTPPNFEENSKALSKKSHGEKASSLNRRNREILNRTPKHAAKKGSKISRKVSDDISGSKEHGHTPEISCTPEKKDDKVVEKSALHLSPIHITVPTESTPESESMSKECDRWEIIEKESYKWKEWRLVKSRDSFFIWCDAVAIEFSDSSNGWFRFILDGHLNHMYSSGSPQADHSIDGRNEFVSKLIAARDAAEPGTPMTYLFSVASNREIEIGSWVLTSPKQSEIHIANKEGKQQRLIIMDDLPGFVFDSNQQIKHCFQAESTLGLEFATGWAARGGSRRLRFRAEAQKLKLQELAFEIWEKYLKEARSKPRDALLKLQMSAAKIKEICEAFRCEFLLADPYKQLRDSLEYLHFAVVNERMFSTFELSISKIIEALLSLLLIMRENSHCSVANVFNDIFCDSRSVYALVRKIVLILEASEKFPLHLYDSPGGSANGLQLLGRRIRFKLELANPNLRDEAQLLDRTGRTLRAEPLVTVGQLRSHMSRMVAKHWWYDLPRESFNFVKQIQYAKKSGDHIQHHYSSDFDDRGIIYWLGTNGRTVSEWINPAPIHVVQVITSDVNLPYGRREDILSRDMNALNCHSSDDKRAYIIFDLGIIFHPTYYTLRHSRGYGRSALRSWNLEGSLDGESYEVLRAHRNDNSLNDPGSTASWSIESVDNRGPYRFIKISQGGKNASNQTYYLSISGFEIYGRIVDVVVDEFNLPESVETLPSSSCGPVQPKKQQTVKGRKNLSNMTSWDIPPTKKLEMHAVAPEGERDSFYPVEVSNFTSEFIKDIVASDFRTGLPIALRSSHGIGSHSGEESVASDGSSVSELVRKVFDSDQPSCLLGERVRMILEEEKNEEKTDNVGRICSPSQNGWVDVLWDSGNISRCRFGAEDRYDVSIISRSVSKAGRSGRISRFSSNTSKTFTPISKQSGRQLISAPRSSVDQAAGTSGLKPINYIGATKILRKIRTSETADNQALDRIEELAAINTGSTISQKSMSTTNLLDRSESEKGYSVASTNQAASAESLQHQTPSLENLLARSKLFGDRILEVVSDEGNFVTEFQEKLEFEVESDISSTNTSELIVAAKNSVHTSQINPVQPEKVEQGTQKSECGDEVNEPVLVESQNTRVIESLPADGAGNDILELESANNYHDIQESDVVVMISDDGSVQSSSVPKHSYVDDIAVYNHMLDTDPMSFTAFDRTNECVDGQADVNFILQNEAESNTLQDGDVTYSQDDNGVMVPYAEALRCMMMQHIMNSSRDDLDIEDIEDDQYYDDLQDDECDDEITEELAASQIETYETPSSEQNFDKKMCWKDVLLGEADRIFNVGTAKDFAQSQSQSGCAKKRNWDDDFILKQQYPSLIPAFDPRPGRTNINQTQDVVIPPEAAHSECSTPSSLLGDESDSQSLIKMPTLALFVRSPSLPDSKYLTVRLDKEHDEKTIFNLLQQVIDRMDTGQKGERSRRISDLTYSLLYGEESEEMNAIEVVNDDITERTLFTDIVSNCLVVLSDLYHLLYGLEDVELTPDTFNSEKLTQKVVQALSDALLVASSSLPSWCNDLIYKYPCLFSFDTRSDYFRATAFGRSRSIVWLQDRRDMMIGPSRGAGSTVSSNSTGIRRDYPEYRIGRIKHERIKVPRNENQLFDFAGRVMRFHASRKSVLEIEYVEEEGTGLGPTLEFYALVAAEYQRKALAMWLCDDSKENKSESLDLGGGVKPSGYYVRRAGGLFPAPIPAGSAESIRVAELFHVLGIFFAKVLQDSRLVDLPLSKSFLKLFIAPEVSEHSEVCLKGLLTIDDLEIIDPPQGKVLRALANFVARKRSIESNRILSAKMKLDKIASLKVEINSAESEFSNLGLTFVINPSSSVFLFSEYELIESGANIDVSFDNVEHYIQKYIEFVFDTGIKAQVEAFRDGFDSVFPLSSLRLFIPSEVQLLLSGEQSPEWTREDIINYTEPKLGYTKESPAFLRFVDVLVGMSALERKSFLQFTTGCSSLPPGGLANLHPRLTIVHKTDSGDGSYPSVNTCVHYLKLPGYSSTEVMRGRLLAATMEKGFHLN